MATVLIAENVPDIAFGLDLLFTRAGHRTHLVATGPDTLAAIQRSAPDLLVMNPSLPGEDGLVICRRLKSEADTVGLPILLLSARYRAEEVTAARHAGADVYLAKPFCNQDLLLHVEALLHRSDGSPAQAQLRSRRHASGSPRETGAADTDDHTRPQTPATVGLPIVEGT